MTETFYSLRIPADEPGPGAARALLAGYGLFADLAAPAGAPPPDYALAAGRSPAAARAQADRIPYRAAAAALTLHLAPFLGYLLYLAVIALIAFFFARPGSLAQPEPSRRLGTEEGLREALNVSIISAAELDRLHSSAARQDQSAKPGPLGPAETPPTETQEAPAPPQQPAVQEANAASSFPQATANVRRDFDPAAYAAFAASQFSAQLNQAFKASEARQQQTAVRRSSAASGRVRSMRPGATHLGQSDQFERDVIWALGATVPEGNGKWGISTVTFTVSAAGQPDGLRLLKSSGDNWLDGAALMAVKQARMPSPPPGLPAGDRTFVIEYISLPGRVR